MVPVSSYAPRFERRTWYGCFVLLASLSLPGGVKSDVFVGLNGHDERLLFLFPVIGFCLNLRNGIIVGEGLAEEGGLMRCSGNKHE